jgi:tRNA pseudouridine38-40 synthase
VNNELPQETPRGGWIKQVHGQKLLLVVEYDGTDFHGFAQQMGLRTVQGTLAWALERVLQEPVQVRGASRTDAGVHAKGQVVHFCTESRIPIQKLPVVLNKMLPVDLKVKQARQVPHDFHARFSAQSRVYRYTLFCAKHPSVWATRFACHFPYPLDVERMQQAAHFLVGYHDFRAFGIHLQPEQNTERTIHRAEVRKSRSRVIVEWEGNAFLRGMVRLMTGSLLLVGRGKHEPDWILELLTTPGARASLMMPPQGLCLVKVNYSGFGRTGGEQEIHYA